jgi:hypothetical protein
MAKNRMLAAVRRRCICRRNAAGAGITVPVPGRQKRGPCCVATRLDRRLSQSKSRRRAEAALHPPLSSIFTPQITGAGRQPAASNLAQLYSIFDENARRTYLGEHISSCRASTRHPELSTGRPAPDETSRKRFPERGLFCGGFFRAQRSNGEAIQSRHRSGIAVLDRVAAPAMTSSQPVVTLSHILDSFRGQALACHTRARCGDAGCAGLPPPGKEAWIEQPMPRPAKPESGGAFPCGFSHPFGPSPAHDVPPPIPTTRACARA